MYYGPYMITRNQQFNTYKMVLFNITTGTYDVRSKRTKLAPQIDFKVWKYGDEM